MTYCDRLKRKRLGDVLVDEGVASKDAVIAALQDQQETQRLLSDILLEMRELSEWDLARVIVEQYQVPYIDLTGYTVHKDLLTSFPPRLLHKAGVVPLDRFGEQICFACQEIPTAPVAEELRAYAPDGMYFYAATALDVRQRLQEHVPLDDDEVVADTQAAAALGAPVPAGDLEDDTGWSSLFDTANSAILSDLESGQDEED